MDYSKLINAHDEGIVLKTVHGSHLYGLNHADSDMDIYIVHTLPAPLNEGGDIRKTNVTQTIVDGIDATVMDLKTFHIQASAGVPQALEAMFSQNAEVDLLKSWRKGFHVSIPSMALRYKHAIEKFAQFDFKRKRHALRYALNLREAMENAGRFNPRLSDKQRNFINDSAMSSDFFEILLKISPVELDLP